MMHTLLTLSLTAQLLISGAAGDSAGHLPNPQERLVSDLRANIVREPNNPDLHLQLATTLHALDQLHPNGGKRIPEAEKAYRATIRLAPAHATMGIYTNLGALLMASGRVDACLEALHTSIALANQYKQTESPLYCGALFNLGKALDAQGNSTAAAASYLQALQASKGVHGSTYTKALASLKRYEPEQILDMEQASNFLEQAAGQSDTASASSDSKAISKKKSRRRRSSGEEGEEEEQGQGQWAFLTQMDAVDQSWLHFALFSAYQQQQKFDKAWQRLRKANELQRSKADYDANHNTMLLKIIQRVFPRAVDNKSADPYDSLVRGAWGYRHASPIFVVGMPRSGSTLVEHILSSHPQAYGAGEDTAFAPLLPDLLRLLERQGNVQEVQELGRRYVEEMHSHIPSERRKTTTRVVDKMLHNVWNIGYIQMLLPQACIIQVVRHPLDTALSCYAQPFEGRGTPWAWDLQDIGQELVLVDKVSRHWQAIFPGQVLVLPYERMVVNLRAAAEDMLQHCGLPWDDAVLQFHQNPRSVHTASLAQVRQRLYNTSVGKWRQYASQLQSAADSMQDLILDYEMQHAAYLPASPSVKDEL